MRRRALACLILTVVGTAVCASVPPASWAPPEFKGPGNLCGTAFTLRLLAGEKAKQGFPSTGYIPYYIDSNGGSYAVVEHWSDSPKLKKRFISRLPNGDVYLVKKILVDYASGVDKRRSYWFQPGEKAKVAFSLEFFEAVPGDGGWGEFPPALYSSVVERLNFAPSATRQACLDPKSAR